jgi:hypothetical protein
MAREQQVAYDNRLFSCDKALLTSHYPVPESRFFMMPELPMDVMHAYGPKMANIYCIFR